MIQVQNPILVQGPEEVSRQQEKRRDAGTRAAAGVRADGRDRAWNMYGFATGFFGRAWRDTPIPVTPISYALNAALAVFSPFVRSDKRWTTRIAVVLWVLMAVWSSVGVLFVSREEEVAPGVPGVPAPGVAAVLGDSYGRAGARVATVRGVFGHRDLLKRGVADGTQDRSFH